MFRTLTEEEVRLAKERLTLLHTSEWTADNLTAILMDTDCGDTGLHEATARAKAERMLSYLKVILQLEVPQKRT
jgi:hypothetical protein